MICVGHTRFLAVLTIVLLSGFGCGGDSENAGPPASGTITVDGSPITEGTINFYPTGDGSSALATIESNGSFSVITAASSAGIAPGEYKVVVESWEIEPVMDDEGEVVEEGTSRVPMKYTSEETSDLIVNACPSIN